MKLCSDFYFNQKINFILHGSDSLDIEYIFNFFKSLNLRNKFNLFLKNTIDTRFLCEFQKYKLNYENNKCSLYIALLYSKSISDKEFIELQKIEQKLHPIYKINWLNINSAIINYAVHDVLHLFKLFTNLSDTETILISEIFHLTMLIKYLNLNVGNIDRTEIKLTHHKMVIWNNIKKITTFKKSIVLIEQLYLSGKLYELLNKYELINLIAFLEL